jgi:transcriptional regulator with XRE-family HTH domain
MCVDKSTINKYMHGTREPDFEMLTKLTARFGVTADYLLGITPSTDDKTA